MNITREVITDLLPAYLSKEASADTRILVEEFFSQDPEFERMVREEKYEEQLGKLPVSLLPEDHETKTLIRTRNMLKWRAHWLTLAILFTLMPLSSVFSSEGLQWMMLRDAPHAAHTFLILAGVSWVQYFRTRRKVRSAGI